MARPTFNTPFYFITSVTHHRLPVFRTDKFKQLLCKALNDARASSGMLFFAYVIMADHVHIITDGKRTPSDTLRYLNGVTARQIIDYLKENGPESSLQKLRLAEKKNEYKYSLWEHHSDKFLITSEDMLLQKVNYIHRNPVADGLAELPDQYQYSSSRLWLRKPLEEEPLKMDLNEIEWKPR